MTASRSTRPSIFGQINDDNASASDPFSDGSFVGTPGSAINSFASASMEAFAGLGTGAPIPAPSITGPSPNLTVTWAGVTVTGAGGFAPPDCNIAAGTNSVITVVNDHIDIYNKTGTELSGQSLNQFFNVPSTNFVFDPQVTWDQFNGRFIVVADDRTQQNSVVHVAVSKDGNPLDGWWFYNFNVKIGNSWLDQPKLGLDNSSLYFQGNYFDFSSGQYSSYLWALNMNALASGQAVTPYSYALTSLGASSAADYHPAHMYGIRSGLNGDFLVSYSQNNSGNHVLNIVEVSNAASGTAIHNFQSLNVGDISDAFTAGARQLGSSTLIDDGDNRIENAVWRNDKLYAVNEIRIGTGSNAHDVVHWFVVDTTNLNNLTLLSQGNIDYGPSIDTYYGDLTVDNAGNIIIGYSYSGPTLYASCKCAVIPAGATSLQDGGVYLSQGQGTYTSNVKATSSDGAHAGEYRWGDYSGIALDPSDNGSFWVFNEYSTSSGDWATQIGGFLNQIPAATIQNDYLAITRTALPLDQATTIANAINAGAQTLTDFINTTVASAKDTTGAILSIFQIMTGKVPDSATLSSEVQLISGLNSHLKAAFGWEAIGASLADSRFSTQYASLYKNLPDTSFITNVYSEVFGSTPGAVTLQALQSELTILKNFYAGATDANDPTGINRAHGNFIADMLHQASDIKFGKYHDASVVFMKDAAAGTAAYGGSLFAQPAPVFAQAVSDSHPSVTLVGVGDPSASHNNGFL